jgi:hypothetical protein
MVSGFDLDFFYAVSMPWTLPFALLPCTLCAHSMTLAAAQSKTPTVGIILLIAFIFSMCASAVGDYCMSHVFMS